jgi:hypothetical protein
MKGGERTVEEVGGEEVEGAVELGGTAVMHEGVGFVQEDVVVDIVIIIVVFWLFLVAIHPFSRVCSISFCFSSLGPAIAISAT